MLNHYFVAINFDPDRNISVWFGFAGSITLDGKTSKAITEEMFGLSTQLVGPKVGRLVKIDMKPQK